MEKTDAREDRRVLHTKTVLRDSLFKLMKEKPISRITPTEICRLAHINRNTFYKHYRSPEMLLESIEDELYNQLAEATEKNSSDDKTELFAAVLQAIRDNADLYTCLFSDYGNKDFLKRFIALPHDNVVADWARSNPGISKDDCEMMATFIINGSTGIIYEWVQGGMKKDPRELAKVLENLNLVLSNAFKIDKGRADK